MARRGSSSAWLDRVPAKIRVLVYGGVLLMLVSGGILGYEGAQFFDIPGQWTLIPIAAGALCISSIFMRVTDRVGTFITKLMEEDSS